MEIWSVKNVVICNLNSSDDPDPAGSYNSEPANFDIYQTNDDIDQFALNVPAGNDDNGQELTEVPWYPFASQKDWEVAHWLMRTSLSMSEIDEYLNLNLRPLGLFYRDPIDCLQSLLSNPQLADCIDFDCRRVYESANRLSHAYKSFMMGNHSWYLQCQIPQGASLLGVILSSDKTKVTNIAVPKFVHSNARACGVLVDWLFHQCISIVTEPLKAAAKMGIMMNDPVGNSRYCFTPLVSYVADTPEELLVACVCSNVSPVTTATQDQFGDPFCHPLRKGSSTLARIKAVLRSVLHADVSEFFAVCKEFNLNGVYEPFWLDWPLLEPSQFITPEALHHWYRMFWNHNLNWCIFVVGANELDFRFMLLQVFKGYCGFNDGVSTLK
ncbi:hypothetical protein DFJ58DRAFT_839668 [Suillus subalutaceus]|uniref:uncharacterized protein n=1 Tax=Suillus subalutaceus TaxID=48586 RepID=UPI001B86D55F|nr:uncharacterized protein DFJ58DRAFT_839668 [Suillus subalutaceus]KAG1861524.1 hypothetical protein DFJ58DRAFT_839668 [Suillus subalutaceus]